VTKIALTTDQPVYNKKMDTERIKQIEEQIAELKSRWPAHSVPPRMWMQLEELEEALEEAKGLKKSQDE